MAKNSKDAYGAISTTSLLGFNPDDLVIVMNKAHPLYDERANLEPDESMVLNVMAHGVIQPIIVRKNPETGDVEVVAGRQRVKALREANRRLKAIGSAVKMIQARVTKGATDGELAGMVVMENEIRKDDTPLNRAAKMNRLRENHGMSEAQIAVIFGISAQTVKATTALLECTAAVKSAVDTGKINVTHALKLSKLPADEQREKVAELVTAGEGKTGHAKAKALRKAAGIKPTVRSAKEINAMLASTHGEAHAALRWALGGDDTSFALPLAA